MKKFWCVFLSLVFALSLLSLASAQTASAKSFAPLCGKSGVSNTTMVATGSTSAHVSITIWHDSCTGKYYASANSFRDSKGFAFTGTVRIVYTVNDSVGGLVELEQNQGCTSSGLCPDTPEVSTSAYVRAEYYTNDGNFYHWSGDYSEKGSAYIIGVDCWVGGTSC